MQHQVSRHCASCATVALMNEGAFNTTFMTGNDYVKWVENEDKRHQALMKEAGLLAGQ